MTSTDILAYEAAPIRVTSSMAYGLYVLNYAEANHVVIGCYAESRDGLQRTHIPGPMVHQHHIGPLVEWLRQPGHTITFAEKVADKSLSHPFTSAGEYAILKFNESLPLAFGKFTDVIYLNETPVDLASRLADAIVKVRNEIWGHPLAEDIMTVSFGDGRFGWITFDPAIDKLRVGFGYYDDTNEPVFGPSSYALSAQEYTRFSAMHFHKPDEPLFALARPAGWRAEFPCSIMHDDKRDLMLEIVRLGDQVWNS